MATKRSNDDQVRRFFSELKSGTLQQNAQLRARRRKSAWNLLLPLFGLPLWLAFTYLLVALAWLAHVAFHPADAGLEHQYFSGPMRLSGFLVFLPSLIASICPALLVTNFLVYLVPPARRAMDNEDRDYPGTDFKSSQIALAKAGAVLFAPALVLVLVGAAIR